MGNCNPCSRACAVKDAEAALRIKDKAQQQKQQQQQQQQQQQPVEDAPLRYGTLGLADCGFEYRQVENASQDVFDEAETDLSKTRLYHITTGDMITSQNRKTYISDGREFDRVVQCCQQIAQERLQKDYGLEWVSLFSLKEGEPPICALASPNFANEERPILMIFTGKGKSRAGIMSVQELVVSGLERGSALYHIHQAIKRGWSVLVLDPNARGKMEGMSLVRRSLESLDWNQTSLAQNPVYIICHSAAGGYLVHYLLDGDHREKLLSSINGLVFTDSTHNLQWAKDDKPVAEILESRRALYIRNCSENPSDTFANHKNKKAGEAHEGNCFWHRRFGNIPTVWAGTTDHAAMCWVARKVIWEFFDARNNENTTDQTLSTY